MMRKDIFKAVQHLEIVARRAVNDQLAGQYHSVFKGRGMDFLDVREYQPGDDVRMVDWNVSARTGELHVKRFVEERELTIFLLVDASQSQAFGTVQRRKRETAAELAALIAFSAIKNNDRVGLLTFTDRVEHFVPPKKGRKHVMRVISDIMAPTVQGRGTSIATALEYLSCISRKKSVAFLISDFIDQSFEQSLRIANRRHELIPLVLVDPMEQRLPNMGIVHFEDPESGELIAVDTSDMAVRRAFDRAQDMARERRERAFKKLRMDSVTIRTDQDHIQPLVNYFRQRARRS